ncbi:uncharacterized protein SPPG_02424 [Spizellomyces punctatus DAOM BR117]|uniref:Uncharacterized protein n=1 Tax=Spizellomyces punctatus (strain DAOM BR117) TaxID=645134 RepID=A0A0L0HLX3_SPIPD|nr:uncharacterized protein SPPG_02424 [Spizellomyces punctatus DAOM BR117]KND01915.1 hypothetical protein SPPG_02424 [Spizellomyces punctatus DAOM BR117]|eukprot:XP_016609954.1 hypothetical protein SPPG_02424 [Spizellomyces punctatus DAOM BR117]
MDTEDISNPDEDGWSSAASSESDPTYVPPWYGEEADDYESGDSSDSHSDSFYEREAQEVEEAAMNEEADAEAKKRYRHLRRYLETKVANPQFDENPYIPSDSEASTCTDMEYQASWLERLYLPDMVDDMDISADDNVAGSSSSAAGNQNSEENPAIREDADEYVSSDGLEGLYSEHLAIRQMRFEQCRTDFCLDRDGIKQLVREAAALVLSNTKFTRKAIDALQTAAEDFLVQRFKLAYRLALSNYSASADNEKQVKLTVKNFWVACAIMEGRDYP